MLVFLKDDLGTLECNVLGCHIWFCDNASFECFEHLKKRFLSIYGEFNITSLCFDTVDCTVSIFRDSHALPYTKISMANFFIHECDLSRFLNLFTKKYLLFEKGHCTLVRRGKKYMCQSIVSSLFLFMVCLCNQVWSKLIVSGVSTLGNVLTFFAIISLLVAPSVRNLSLLLYI